jgi:hypothetical protein
MLFKLIDKIKKYVNQASDDTHMLAIVLAFTIWIAYLNYKERIFPNTRTEAFDPYHINCPHQSISSYKQNQ